MLVNIQALRALAALLVVIAHVGGLSAALPFMPKMGGHFGIGGVDLFFVISGFIMVFITHDDWNPARFLIARALRIYPLWWLCLAVVLSGVMHEIDPAWLASSFLLLPWISPSGELYPAFVPGWTLIYEVYFYALFAITMMATNRRLISLKLAALIGALAVFASLLPSHWAFHQFATRDVLLEFIFGAIIGELYLARRITFALVVPVALLGIAVWFSGYSRDEFRALFYGVPSGAAVAVALFLEQRLSLTASRFVQTLGNASYSLYLVHVIVVPPTARLIYANVGPLEPLVWYAALMLTAILAALAVHFCVEKPLRTLGRTVYRRRISAAPAP